MNLRTTVVLAIVAALAAAAVWMFAPSAPSTSDVVEDTFKPPPSATEPILSSVDPLKAVEARWSRSGKTEMVFAAERDTSSSFPRLKWRMIAPVAAAAESHLVDSLVNTSLKLQFRTKWAPDAKDAPSPAAAGLEPPQAVLTVKFENQTETRVEIGRKLPMSTDTYVRINGAGPIYAAAHDFAAELKREPREFRGKQLLTLTAGQVTRVALAYDGRNFVFNRVQPGAWKIEAPVEANGNPRAIDELVSKAVILRAADFAEDAPVSLEPYGLQQPYLRVELTASPPADPAASAPASAPAPRTVALLVGGFADLKQTQRFVKLEDQPWVASVAKSAIDAITPDMQKLRDTAITALKSGDIAAIEYSQGGLTAQLTNEGGRWSGGGELDDPEPVAISDLTEALAGLTALDFLDRPAALAEYGLDAPRATIKATLRSSGAVLTLLVGKTTESKQNAFVMIEGRPTVYVVSAAQADRLAPPILALRNRQVFAFDVQSLERVQVSRAGTTYLLVRQPSGWTLLEPLNCPIDAAAVRELTTDLSRLTAIRVVSRADFGRYGLDEPVATLTLSFASPASSQASQPVASPTRILRVGFRDNAAYVRRDEEPWVYQIDNGVYEVLIGELIERRLFTFSADDVVLYSVRVAPDREMSLMKRDGKWICTQDPYVRLSDTKIKEFLDQLAAMRVQAYLAYHEGDLAASGLGTRAPVQITIRLKNLETIEMRLAEPPPGELPRLGALTKEQRIFQLKKVDAERLLNGVEWYAAPQSPPPGEAPPSEQPPGMPPMPPGMGPG